MMKSKYLRCNPFKLAGLVLSIFLSAPPLWANSIRCGGVHQVSTALKVGRLQGALATVPLDDYGRTPEKWKIFESSIDSIFQTNEMVHEFLWKFAQSLQRLKGMTLANPSQAAMRELREGRPMPDELRPLNEIEASVLGFVSRLPEASLPPTVLLQNYRALLMLTSEANPQELRNLKSLFAATPPENPLDPAWTAQFIQRLDAIQKRLGHRLLP